MQLSTTTTTALITIIANDGLQAMSTGVILNQAVTYTLRVTNTSPSLPATQVILTGRYRPTRY